MLYSPAVLIRRKAIPLDPGYVFELKHDGWRSLVQVQNGIVRLISRKGNVLKSFPGLVAALANLPDCVIDAEIVVLDSSGRSQFWKLMARREEPALYAFDILAIGKEDLRNLTLYQRKRKLFRLIRNHPRIVAAQHFEDGVALFQEICKQDLEGIVAKRRDAPYGVDWFKILNPDYSQREGRREWFEKDRAAR